ncbi:MAG: electron transfer flavoprotein-ubiquinone oxidoreductase [Planctomycetota bacterium]|nr:electron transfer flavoprotein-ubiquinone oxidoreductase [Planctomycetota bacterium]GIK51864.1 MAG: electron transfer flavoprotein-ubiquinone oxidoreductase [Planctomycetota bacterium]
MSESHGEPYNPAEITREEMPCDVLLVGAGPANLALAIRLKQLVASHNESAADDKKLDPQIYVIEKGAEVGNHQLSGAVMDPRGIEELMPDWREKGFPVEGDVGPGSADKMLKLGETSHKAIWVPPIMHNRGKVVVSLNKVVKWLAQQAESLGVNVFAGFAGAEVLYDGKRVLGVRTRDMGVNKWSEKKGEFMPGVDLKARVTVLGEGTRGSLAKHLIPKLELDKGRNEQVYQLGVKEVWKLGPKGQEKLKPGDVYHTMKWPLPKGVFGGGWIYGMADGMVSIGLVTGLDYKDPALDPHALFQRWKTHPFLKSLLEDGELLHYGAKTIPDGGYFSQPRLIADGVLLVGDTAGMLNAMRLKGIHLAIKSGMLAAETIFECLKDGDFSAQRLQRYQNAYETSWAKEELFKVRNFRQGFQRGEFFGMVNVALGFITGGRGLAGRLSAHADYREYHRLPGEGGTTKPVDKSNFDDKLTFDKLKDVYFSASKHEEDQPCHLQVTQPDICVTRCTREYGNPCQHFCPANVYEMVPKAEGKGASPQLNREGEGKENAQGLVLKINASNCVHCKTCDIKDPYQIINWVVPEGGQGPVYTNL